MRLPTRAVTISALLAAACATGVASPETGRAGAVLDSTSRESAVVRWALSHAPVDEATRTRVAALAAKGTAEADEELFSIGEPARRVLLALTATDAALAARTAPLRARMQDLQDEVERRDLHCDLNYLSTLGPAAAARVARIVPEGAPREGAVAWCMDRAGSLRWEPALDRFVVAPPWDRDQAPRRWRGRDTVILRRTAGMNCPSTAFTAEFWVRWPERKPQYLLADECWPEMSPSVPVDRERGGCFRRNHRGDGTATLDFTYAIAVPGTRGGWYTVESAPLRVSTQWEHVAVSSDGRVIRLFRNGEMVAARDAAGVPFVGGVTDLALGVRPDGLKDRRADFDLRAFRVSEGARYTADFVPPRRFERDGSTVLLLDFTPGNDTLRDLSGGGHDAAGQGAWIAPLDLEALRSELAVFGGSSGPTVLAEAERGGRSGQWFVSDRPQYSEGVNLEIWSDQDPGAEGHVATIPFRVPSAGRWRLHFVGGGLHRGDQGFSPFSWRVDDGAWTPVVGPLPALYGILGRSDLDLSPLGVAELSAGEHVFRLRLLSRRRHKDHRWSLWMDALVLAEADGR